MKTIDRGTKWTLIFLTWLSGQLVFADPPTDLAALTQETQKMLQKADAMTMVWWVPEEFWEASLAQTPGLPKAQADEFMKVIRPYTMLVIVDGTMGVFGGVTYRQEEYIRANTRFVDVEGKSHTPKSEQELDSDTRNMLQMLKPVLVNMLGPLGQNMHFLLFPAQSKSGARIASPRHKGQISVKLSDKEFHWRLPLDSLLASTTCLTCRQECKGSWSFCPWCGKNLARK